MKKIGNLFYIILLVAAYLVGYAKAMVDLGDEFAQTEAEVRERIDPSYIKNYVWSNVVETYEPCGDGETISWFEGEYDALEKSWQKAIHRFGELPGDMQADAVQFSYIPWTQELLNETKRRDLPHKDLKVEILELRLKSLEALNLYFRSWQEMHHEEYIKHDSRFREITRDHPELFE